MGLVDEDRDAPASHRLGIKKFVQLRVHLYKILTAAIETQGLQQIAKKLVGIALCLEQEGAPDRALQPLEKLEQQRGLTHPRLGNQSEKSTPRIDPIEERCQSLAMRGSEVKKARVRSHAEGLLP